MKIVQTFWTGATTQPGLHLTGGWMAPEYHWMAWALSVLQLKRFYDRVELITDDLGKHILIDLLQLPYANVRVELGALTIYPSVWWALAKIKAESLQNEPFLHVDGDVFIWKPFSPSLLSSNLVAQNEEVSFPFYDTAIAQLTEQGCYLPACMAQSPPYRAYNAGVIGGQNHAFFKRYAEEAFTFATRNSSYATTVSGFDVNMLLEQGLFYSLTRAEGETVTCVLGETPVDDPTYPGLANFMDVPYQTAYIHTMGDYKRQEVVVWHLASRLRQDYPTYYYRILRLCREAGLSLHNTLYETPELNPSLHDDDYFAQLRHAANGSASANTSALYHYGKGLHIYQDVETLFSRPFCELLSQSLVFNSDARLDEETEPTLKQTLHFQNPIRNEPAQKPLDSLDMVLYDAFLESKPIGQAIDEASAYFPSAEVQGDYRTFQNLVLDRIKEGMYLGTLQLV